MTHALVLQLLIEMVKFSTEALKDCPADVKAKMWERHDKRMDFWEDAWKGLKGE
jgi:hypothetical protein